MDPVFKNASVNSSESGLESSQTDVFAGALPQSPQPNSKERRNLLRQSSGNVSNSQDGDSEELRERLKNDLDKHELQLLALFEDIRAHRSDRDDRRDARPRGASRASSIENLPQAQYSGTHPLNHPYIHSANFPQRSLEVHQGPDFSTLDVVLNSDLPRAVSDWMRKVEKIQALYPRSQLPIWALLSEDMQLRVRGLFWDQNKTTLDGRTHLLDLPKLITLLRNSFYPQSVVMFVSLFKELVGTDHFKLLPPNYRPTFQNFKPMIKVVTSIAGNVNHALAVILGDQVRAKRDVSSNVLPPLDSRGNDHSSSPGFMKIWCDLFPEKFGWYIHEKVQKGEEFYDVQTYEDYISLWLRFFDLERKRAEEISNENATMNFYTGNKSQKSSEAGPENSSSARTNFRQMQTGQDPVTPKKFIPHKFASQRNFQSRTGVSSMQDFDEKEACDDLEPGVSVQDEGFSAEELVFLSTVAVERSNAPRQSSHPTSILSKSQTPVRPHVDSKSVAPHPCFIYARTGSCEKRDCNFSHDRSQARVSWKEMVDQLMSSPFAEASYKPKISKIPAILPSRLAYLISEAEEAFLQQIVDEHVPVKYSAVPGLSSGEVTKTPPRGSAISNAIEDY